MTTNQLVLPALLFGLSVIVKTLVKIRQFDRTSSQYPFMMFDSFCFGAELCLVSLALLAGNNFLSSLSPSVFLPEHVPSGEFLHPADKVPAIARALVTCLLINVGILLGIIALRIGFSKDSYFEYEDFTREGKVVFRISLRKTLKKSKFWLCLLLVNVLGVGSVFTYFFYVREVRHILSP